MNLVSCYKASKIAGVTKQAISDMKKKNDELWGKYPFFVFVPSEGKVKVDVDSASWTDYLNRNLNNPNKKKIQIDSTELSSSKAEEDNNDLFFAVIDSCTESVKELFNPSEKKIGELNDLIMEKFGEKMG